MNKNYFLKFCLNNFFLNHLTAFTTLFMFYIILSYIIFISLVDNILIIRIICHNNNNNNNIITNTRKSDLKRFWIPSLAMCIYIYNKAFKQELKEEWKKKNTLWWQNNPLKPYNTIITLEKRSSEYLYAHLTKPWKL